MTTRTLAWGVTGGVSLLMALACSGKLKDVGDLDSGGSGGSGASVDKGGSAGSTSDIGGTDAGGSAGSSPDACQTSGGSTVTLINGQQYYCGGSGGGGSGGGGSGGGDATGAGGFHHTCFAEFSLGDDDDKGLGLGPQNTVFVDAHVAFGSDVKNYADQIVFGDIGVWEAYANFPTSELAADTALSLPADISRAPANLGQFYITRQNCAGLPAAGHKLTVQVWWKLGSGGLIGFPTEGLALGTVTKNKPVWFDDTVHAFVTGEPEAKRVINTLNRLVIEHTFADDDTTDAGKITLGLWLLPDFDFASTLYIGNVKWD